MLPIYTKDKKHKRTYNEIIPNANNEAFVFRIFADDKIHDIRHKHNEVEIIYILNGVGTKSIGDNMETCADGDLTLINPRVPHYYTIDPINANAPVEAWVVQFDKYCLGQKFYDYAENIHLKCMMDAANQGVCFSDETIKATAKIWKLLTKATGVQRLEIFIRLLGLLSKPGCYRPITGSFFENSEKHNSNRMQQIKNYIQQNYMEKISLAELSKKVHLSKPAFCNLFKKTFNVCFSDYLSEIRLSHAAKLLAETDLSVTLILTKVGFENQSYFNRCFKRHYSVSPLAYRKSLNWHIVDN